MLERFTCKETSQQRLENLENITPEEASKNLLNSKAWPALSIIITAIASMALYDHTDAIPFVLQAGTTATVATLANCGRHWSKLRRINAQN